MKLVVQCDRGVEDSQLQEHFSQFGEVKSVSTSEPGNSTVTFSSSAVVEQLDGEEHSVLLGGDQDEAEGRKWRSFSPASSPAECIESLQV